MRTSALILAAGSSKRLGAPKQLLDWGGRPLLEVVTRRAKQWPVDEVWVVLGHGSEDILLECDLGDVSIVINEEYDEGMASSLRVGLDALTRSSKVDATFVVMGDQPVIDDDVPAALIAAMSQSQKMVALPRYRYTRGNPALLSRDVWPRVMSLEGDIGAMGLFQAHPEWVEEVWFETLPPRDIDTQQDVEELRPRSA